MTTNNAQLFLANYSGYDLFSKCDPNTTADLKIDGAAEVASFAITQDGTMKAKIIPEVPETISIDIRASDLKNDNLGLYNALLKPGSALGTATLSRGNTTEKHEVSVAEKGMVQAVNPAGFSTVGLKFKKL